MTAMRCVNPEEVEDLIWECDTCRIEDKARELALKISRLRSSAENGCQRCKVYLQALYEYRPVLEASVVDMDIEISESISHPRAFRFWFKEEDHVIEIFLARGLFTFASSVAAADHASVMTDR